MTCEKWSIGETGASGGRLLGLVDAGLVVLVLGVEARLEVVDERGRHQLAHHLRAVRHQQRARVRRGPGGAGRGPRQGPRGARGPRRRERRRGRAAAAPLRDLALDIQRAALRAAAAPHQVHG